VIRDDDAVGAVRHRQRRVLARPEALLAFTAVVVPICVAYGYLSARLVEQPVRRWARRFGRRAQEPAAAPRAQAAPPIASRSASAEGDA